MSVPRYTIDRFEGADWAVLEDERARTFPVPRRWLPVGVAEGDVLNASDTESDNGHRVLHFEIDVTAREERLKHATHLRQTLPQGPKGDISL